MSNTEGEGDVLTLEVVLSPKQEATTYDMLALLDNITPEELLEIMVTKKIEEIASIMQMNPQTVKTRLRRGRETLRALLCDEENAEYEYKN